VRGDVLEGDLVARAAGDPLFAPGGVIDASRFAPLVDALSAAGVRRVRGALVLDEGSFLVPGPGPAWPSDDQHWQEYCALAGGFSANGGCLDAVVAAGAVGRPARVGVEPRAHGLVPAFDVTTAAARSRLVVRVSARGGKVTVAGSLPADVPRWTTRFAAPDPVELYGHVLLDALARGGIRVEGGIVRRRGEPTGRPLATLTSPLAALLEPINTESDNALADQVFLALGDRITGSGTRAGGRAATAFALAALDVPVEGLVQVDGSGLSRDNRATARQITALLDAVLSKDARTGEAFRASLAVAGESGTLQDRMRGLADRVHAKTGFIGGTSALSGVVETGSGRRLAFSILVEYPVSGGLNTSVWKPLQDDLCAELARYSR
jgi:D-alanyl-D-alanine carboxypeptidase/D-alanyl-D-alanine-endopeptidase (penicillin-binding protein 4)